MQRTHCVGEVLEGRGVSQRWLANQLGVSDSYLSRLLSGDKTWSEAFKTEVARLIMVPRAVLFFELDSDLESPDTRSNITEDDNARAE
jgi:transcriptional regulator with XRE-family HTH domain